MIRPKGKSADIAYSIMGTPIGEKPKKKRVSQKKPLVPSMRLFR